MIIKAIAFSARGMDLGTDLSLKLKEGPLKDKKVDYELTRCESGGLSAWAQEAFGS